MKLPSWLQKIVDKIKEWINNNTTTTTTTPNGTTTTTTTPVTGDLDLTKATWQGAFKGPNAKSTVIAKNLSVNGDNISMEWNLHTWNAGDEYCDGLIMAAWKMNDKWNAAYLDYCPKGRTGYKWDCLKNMANSSYEPKPTKGTECGFFIMSQKLDERSNVLMSTWPLDSTKGIKKGVFGKLFGWMYKDNPEAPSVKPPHNGKPNNWPVFKK
jgi:hypothetical protein